MRALLLLTLLWGPPARADEDWRALGTDRGVKLAVHQEPGRHLPTFRGQAVIVGRVLHVLAVVLDTMSARSWARGADEIVALEDGAREALIYMLTDPPWPISDRDMVLARSVDILEPARAFRVTFRCVDGGRPRRSGVIRVHSCDYSFTLRRRDDAHTFVEYQVSLDPGGALPAWAVRWIQKRAPTDTIVKLEREVRRTPDKYDALIQAWASAQ